jgi:uncharacterized protein (DUF362 family)
MLLEATDLPSLKSRFDEIGLTDLLARGIKIGVKINLPRLPKRDVPRTDLQLLRYVIDFLYGRGCRVTVLEGANGFLESNIRSIGLGEQLDAGIFDIIDLDCQEGREYIAEDGETHFLPECLGDFDLRIAVPVTRLGKNTIFSNNVKIFVGVVPRRFYQNGSQALGRPKIHQDLHRSIANIYSLVRKHYPFHFYINGGNCLVYNKNLSFLPKYFVSDDGARLDLHILKWLNLEMPEYLANLIGAK